MRGITAKRLRRLTGYNTSVQANYDTVFRNKEIIVPRSDKYPRGYTTIQTERRIILKGEPRRRYQSMKGLFKVDKPRVLDLMRGLGL